MTDDELQRFALAKMGKVLGPDRAERVLTRILEDLRIDVLRTPQDLLRASERMSALGGMEAAVGALLGLAAVVRGARPA